MEKYKIHLEGRREADIVEMVARISIFVMRVLLVLVVLGALAGLIMGFNDNKIISRAGWITLGSCLAATLVLSLAIFITKANYRAIVCTNENTLNLGRAFNLFAYKLNDKDDKIASLEARIAELENPSKKEAE